MSKESLDTLNILPNAVARTYELLALENNFNSNLRVYVVGGGCSGFQYAFEFNSDISDTDLIINKFYNPTTKEIIFDEISMNHAMAANIASKADKTYKKAEQGDKADKEYKADLDHFRIENFKKVSFVVDQISLNYLCGSNLDYVSDLKGARFKIDNPNALATCSCGSSFTIEGT